jgi:hypothetical protein
MEASQYISDFNKENIIGTTPLQMLENIKANSRGLQTIWRKGSQNNKKSTKIQFYTTAGTGSNIRNAESGSYYSGIVGTYDENQFFKVVLATGECKNGSSTLFYNSPQQYMSHMNVELDQSVISGWEEKQRNN